MVKLGLGGPMPIARDDLSPIAVGAAVTSGDPAQGTEHTPIDRHFPSWPKSLLFEIFVTRLSPPVWVVWLGAFIFYWGIPLCLATLDHSLVTSDQFKSINAEARSPLNLPLLSQWIVGNQTTTLKQAYLADLTHFLFSILLASAGVAGLLRAGLENLDSRISGFSA
jgi:hypothetical protein